MVEKKILIVCRAFYPDISPRSFRVTELAKEFARQGHVVTVLFPTNGRNYTIFEKENILKIKNLGKLNWRWKGLRDGKTESLLRRALRRTLQVLFEYPDIELMFRVSKILKQEMAYDLLLSIAVPHPIHWGVARVWDKKQKVAKTWIADCGDPFMLARLDTYRKPFYFKFLEKEFCRKCDFITIPIESARSAYYPEFSDKIRVIPQGFNLDETKVFEYKKLIREPTFAYAGSFIPGQRDPRPFLNYLTNQKKDFKFFIYTSQLGLLMPYKEKLSSRLEIMEPVPRKDLLQILASMDFLVNFDNNTDKMVPSKLIDYALTGRPVLNITKDFDLKTVDDFLNAKYEKRIEFMNLEAFDIKNVTKQFIELAGFPY